MKDLLDLLGNIVGNQVLAGVVLILVGYYSVIGGLRILAGLRDHRLNLSTLEATRRKYEILKLVYEIEALKKEHSLIEENLERQIKKEYEESTVTSTTPQGIFRSLVESIGTPVTAYLRRNKGIGYLSLYFAHIALRIVPGAFLTLISMFEWFGGPEVHWERAFPLSLALVLGFLLSNYIVQAVNKADLRDPIGVWSYVIGGLVGLLSYILKLYPSSF